MARGDEPLTDIFDILRLVNLVLLVVLVIGLVTGWWRHRRERLNPLGIAALAFALALLYGTIDALANHIPAGGRPAALLAAALVANVCVYVPLFTRRSKP